MFCNLKIYVPCSCVFNNDPQRDHGSSFGNLALFYNPVIERIIYKMAMSCNLCLYSMFLCFKERPTTWSWLVIRELTRFYISVLERMIHNVDICRHLEIFHLHEIALLLIYDHMWLCLFAKHEECIFKHSNNLMNLCSLTCLFCLFNNTRDSLCVKTTPATYTVFPW